MNFLSSLEDIVGFLDCVRVHIQSIQVAVPQMAQVRLVACIRTFYELNGQGYLFCLLLIGHYWHSPTMLLRDVLYEGSVRDSNPYFIQHFHLCKEDFVISFQLHVFPLTELVKSHLHVRQTISQLATFFKSEEEGTDKYQQCNAVLVGTDKVFIRLQMLFSASVHCPMTRL